MATGGTAWRSARRCPAVCELRRRLAGLERRWPVPPVHEAHDSARMRLLLSDPEARELACDLTEALAKDVPDPRAEAIAQALQTRLEALSAHTGKEVAP